MCNYSNNIHFYVAIIDMIVLDPPAHLGRLENYNHVIVSFSFLIFWMTQNLFKLSIRLQRESINHIP